MSGLRRSVISRVDQAIEAQAEEAFSTLSRLVAAPSLLGSEAAAQEIVAEELARLDFQVERVPIPADIRRDPAASVFQGPYTSHYDVIGRRVPTQGRSLLINGHIDVVPAGEPQLWTTDPFRPDRRNGWLYGRGAGDMKGGFAMTFLAISALREAYPRGLEGPLFVVSAVEEECTGNGTLAAVREGYLADAAVLAEPTGLSVLLGGVGILWVEIGVLGRPGHAASARSVNPLDAAITVINGLRRFEETMNSGERAPILANVSRPYNVNIGTINGGDWASSVPSVVRLGVRVGFPRSRSAQMAEERVTDAVLDAAQGDPWLREHPPAVRSTGFRAEGHVLDASTSIGVGDASSTCPGSRLAPHDAGLGQHDGRPLLPQRGGLSSALLRSHGTPHPWNRRGGGTGEHRRRRSYACTLHRGLVRNTNVARRERAA